MIPNAQKKEKTKQNNVLHSNTPLLHLSSSGMNNDKLNVDYQNPIPLFHLLQSPYMSAKYNSEPKVVKAPKPKNVIKNVTSGIPKHKIQTMSYKGNLPYDHQIKGYYMKDKKDQNVILFINMPEKDNNAIRNALALNKKQFLFKKKLAQKKKIHSRLKKKNFFFGNMQRNLNIITQISQILCAPFSLILQLCKKSLTMISNYWKKLNFLYGVSFSSCKLCFIINQCYPIPSLTLNELFKNNNLVT